ncbi:MAG: VCBS repeat-containing protein [Verrucomicrobia bacterium]|nr:VCBS repeat-containing protein [Verrucomicrobiota bacterium]
MRTTVYPFSLLIVIACLSGCGSQDENANTWPEGAWKRHTIDDSSFGADGTRFADINKDGRLDITSPWEQGGQVRVYINPGNAGLRDPWPAVTVGEVGDPEDSFFVDLDDDGFFDVVSSCEGETRAMFVHWSPTDPDRLLDPQAWETAEFSAASGLGRWMYGFAMQVDGKAGVDLVAGAKSGYLGWFESPNNPRDLKSWRWHPLIQTQWPMTLRPNDIDGDGDLDIVATERRGPRRGAFWMENPGASLATSVAWKEHRIGLIDEHEALHNTIADLDGDGLEDVLVAVKGGPIRFHRRASQSPLTWETYTIEIPPHAGGGKAVKVADINLDGQLDLAVSCEHAIDGKIGTYWLSYNNSPTESQWSPTSISGPEGFINDLIQLTDLDGDGDLDVVTVEEKGPYLARGYQGKELGVIWYENPAR